MKCFPELSLISLWFLIVGNASANNVTISESTIETESEELTTEQLVEEALGNIINSHSTTPDLPPTVGQVAPPTTIPAEVMSSDLMEDEIQSDFISVGCGCHQQCHTKFDPQYIKQFRLSCLELARGELDSVILGQLSAFSNTTDFVATDSRHALKHRERSSTTYYHQGKTVCASLFFFIHTVGGKRSRNLLKHFIQNGITPHIHGNTKRLPKHSLTLKSTEYIIRFLLNYAEQNALLLPGRVPGYRRSDLKLLPSSTSKRGIWNVYYSAATLDSSIHAAAYTTFCRLWRTLLPSVA